MRNSFSLLSVLLLGFILGWLARDENISRPEIESDVFVSEYPLNKLEVSIDKKTDPTTVPPIILDKKFLANTQLDKLIELMKQDANAEEQANLDDQLVRHTVSLLSKPQAENIERQLENLLNIESIQSRILPLIISFHTKSNNNEIAMEYLYQLRRLANYDDDYNRLTTEMKTLADRHIKKLDHAKQIEKLTHFYQKILNLEPDNFEMQMKFAKHQYQNRNYEAAINLLDVLVYHSTLGSEAVELKKRAQHQLNRLLAEDVPIPMTRNGHQYIVNAIINDIEPVKLILDTGASMTVLSPNVVSSLGLADDANKTMRFSTANGDVRAAIVEIDKLDILHYSVANLAVGVLPSFPIGDIDGLLGMNYLSQFSFFIDQENLTLQLGAPE